MLKAYFPNLISNKDPTKARGSDLHPQKKKLFAGSKSSQGDTGTRDVNLLPGGPPEFISNISRKKSQMENLIYDPTNGANTGTYVAATDFEQEVN